MVDGRVIAVSDKDTSHHTTSTMTTTMSPTHHHDNHDVIMPSSAEILAPLLEQLAALNNSKQQAVNTTGQNNSNNTTMTSSTPLQSGPDVITILARCIRSLHERLEASERRNRALTSQVRDLNSKLRGQLIPVVKAMIEIRDEFRSGSSSCDLPSSSDMMASPAPSDASTSSAATNNDILRPLYACVNKAKRPLPSLPPPPPAAMTSQSSPRSVYECIESGSDAMMTSSRDGDIDNDEDDVEEEEKTLFGKFRRKMTKKSTLSTTTTNSSSLLPRSSDVMTSRGDITDDEFPCVFSEPVKETLPFEWKTRSTPDHDLNSSSRRGVTSSVTSHVSFDELDQILEATRKLTEYNNVSISGNCEETMRTTTPNSGVILNEAQAHQEDMRRLESGGVAANWSQPPQPDEAPPKPRRPRAGAGSLLGGGSPGVPPIHRPPGAYPPTGAYPPPTTQAPSYPPMIPPGRMPLVPPKTHPKVMSPDDVVKHEAQEKLRQRQQEEKKIIETLEKQKQERAVNEDWLRQSEQQMNPDTLAPGVAGLKMDGSDPAHIYSSADEVRPPSAASSSSSAPPPPSVAPAKPPRNPQPRGHSSALPKVEFEEVKPTPTMQIDRRDDKVYHDTMMVVKSVLQANQAILKANSNEILGHVKTIGSALKQLAESVSSQLPKINESHHRDIDMAQKTTNKDLSQIIAQMRLVNRFISTSQVADYKKCLMAATQVLAMDVKNLLDVVDSARIASARNPSDLSSRPPLPNLSSSSSSQDLISSADDDDLPLPPPPSQFLDG